MQQNSPTRKLRIHFVYKKLYKMYTTDVYKTFTKSKELCQLNFVYIMYTKVCRNVRYIVYTFCIKKFVEMWDTFCIQSNLCITTTWGIKFLQLLQTGGRYEEDLCITAKTANSDIWLLYKGSIIFHLITHDTVKNKSACVFVRNRKLL